LLDEVDIPKTLGKNDVPEDCAERIAEKATSNQRWLINCNNLKILVAGAVFEVDCFKKDSLTLA
jgi:hypothetical protein